MARVSDLLAAGRTFSFEFFPPQTDSAQLSLGRTIAELEPLAPSFVSVTYGAGGSSRQRTREVVTWVRKETAITPMAHLTCQGHSRAEIAEILDDYRVAGIENILALGGDIPGDLVGVHPSDYTYAVRPPRGHRRRRLLDRRRRPPGGAPAVARPGDRPPPPGRQARPRRLRDHPVLLRGRALPAARRRAPRARRRQAGAARHHADHQRRAGPPDGRSSAAPRCRAG